MSGSIPGTTRWNVIFLALLAGIFGAFQNGKMPATLPTLTEDLGLSLVQAGFAVSLLFGIACVIGIGAGAVADYVGARRIIVVGLVVTAAASAAGGFASGPAGLFASRLAEGLGVTAVFVAAPSMILRATAPRHQRLAFGIWSGYMPAGVAIMILISPAAIALVGWRGLWWLNGALLLAMAAIFYAATRGARDPGGARGGLAGLRSNLRAVLGARGAWLLALCFTLYTAMYLCISSFLPTLLITTAGFAPAWAGTATALVVALNVFGNLLGGVLLHRGLPRGMLVAIGAGTMGTMSMVVYATDLAAAWKLAAAAAFSFVGGLLPSSVMAGAAVHAPSPAQVGTTNGLILQLGNGGQLAGPPIFAALATLGGWSLAAWFTLALGLVGAAFGLAIGLHEKRRAAAR
jgi:MFS family permease